MDKVVKSNKNILAIIIMFALFFMVAFVTGLQNPCGLIVKSQFALSDFESQLGNFANFIAYAFMGIPAGLILQKKGYKITSIVAVCLGLLGVLLMIASSMPEQVAENSSLIYAMYIAGAFVAGFSMCTLNTVVNPMLNTLGGGGNRGNQLIQFGGVCNSTAATIVPILVGYLLGGKLLEKTVENANEPATAFATLVDARVALYIAVLIFMVALLVLIFSKIPEPLLEEAAKKETKEKVSFWGAFKYGNFVGGVIAIFLYVGVEVGIANFLNLYLTAPAEAAVKSGFAMTTTVAGVFVGAYWFLMLVGRVFGGIIAGAVSPRAMLGTVSALCIVLLLCGMFLPSNMVTIFGHTVPLNALFFVACGLCTSVMWGGIFNLATEGLNKYTAIASGIFMVMVCGGGVLPLVQGLVADMSGYVSSYWVLVIAVGYIFLYAMSTKKVTK